MLRYISDFIGLECNGDCGRKKMDLGICLYCEKSKTIEGKLDVIR